MNIVIVREPIKTSSVKELAKEYYVTMIKGVADVNRGLIALGGEYHMDANEPLTTDGSVQNDLWGFNIFLDRGRDKWLEYTSLINIRPTAGNTTIEVTDESIREAIRLIVDRLII